jgi:hypothetical protein
MHMHAMRGNLLRCQHKQHYLEQLVKQFMTLVALMRICRLPDDAFTIQFLTMSSHRAGLVILVLLNNFFENGTVDAALFQAE